MNRKYRGFAGHLVVSASCRFHLCTEVGDVLVSTIGAYVAPTSPGPVPGIQRVSPEGWTTIGYDRLFETMVFPLAAAVCACGCGDREIADWNSIDFEGYNTPREATKGHERMCQQYEALATSENTQGAD